MRKSEKPFSITDYACMSEERAAERMLALNYCQVSRRFGHVARVDVSDEELLVRLEKYIGSTIAKPVGLEGWYDFYRRCVSEDVITNVPEPIMFMIRNPGFRRPIRKPRPSDEEFVEMIVALGLVVE